MPASPGFTAAFRRYARGDLSRALSFGLTDKAFPLVHPIVMIRLQMDYTKGDMRRLQGYFKQRMLGAPPEAISRAQEAIDFIESGAAGTLAFEVVVTFSEFSLDKPPSGAFDIPRGYVRR